MERTYPRHVIAAVSAVLIHNNKILLIKRKYPPVQRKWSLPGGVLEAGEKLGEAARRELREETGLEAEPIGILWILNNIVYDESNRVLYHYLIVDVLFDPNTISGELKPGTDAIDAKWFEISEVKYMSDASRTIKRLIERIEKYGLTIVPLEGVDHISVQV